MTLTATYSNDLSRVRLAFTGAPGAADYARVERSTDQVTWVSVRGGQTVAITAGAGTLDDYEFAPGVPNYYRASYVDTAPVSVVGEGAVATGVGTGTLAPAVHASTAAGDVVMLVASIRNAAATVNLPAGWTSWVDLSSGGLGFVRVMAKRWQPGDTVPTVSFTGGTGTDTTHAFTRTLRNASVALQSWTGAAGNSQSFGYAPIAYGADVDGNPVTGIQTHLVAWKQIAASNFTAAGAWTGKYGSGAGSGSGESLYAWYLPTQPNSVPEGAITDTAAAAQWLAITLGVPKASAVTSADTTAITPDMPEVWLKNLQRPYLNRKLTVTDWSDVARPARAGVFDVIARSSPIAVTDLRGSRRYTLTVTTTTLGAADDFDATLVAGEPVLLHVPAEAPFPGMYAVIGDTAIRRAKARRSERRYFDLPLTEVAAPDPTIVGETVLWADIVSTFATWSALMASEPTWADVVDRIGDPTDVITG